MATVIIQKRNRKKGITYPVYYKDPRSGNKKYYRTYQRLKDAQQTANELRGLLDSGNISELSKSKLKLVPITFEEVSTSLLKNWGKKVRRSELAERTMEGYSYFLGFVRKVFGHRLLCEISLNEIVDYRDKVAFSASNIMSNRTLFIIKQVFVHGLELNAIKQDPICTLPYLSEREHERNKFLMPDALKKLVEACKTLRARYYLPAAIYLGAEHGASKQEVLDLKWSDISFEYAGIGLIRFFRTKTKKMRTEFLMPRTRQALIDWHQHQAWMRHRKKIKENGSGLVFCRLDGTPIKRFDKGWRQARKIAALDWLHFHDLRHTFCSNLLLSGADLKDIKEMIGHRDLSMTDRYAHLDITRKLLRQQELARFYSIDDPQLVISGGHIGVTSV